MTIIYNLVFLIFAIFYLPLYFLRGKFHRGFSRRFGFLPSDLNLDRPIWIHAVSVGEVIAVKGLITELRKAYPQKRLVISTVTETGNKLAKNLIKEGDLLTYLPLDFSFIVKKVIKRINPGIFIIAETEIWPNLINCLYKQNIPVITVNGRISDASYGGYRAIKLFIQPILRKISQFCMQSDTDALRLQKLGAERSRVQVTGNVKFDINLDSASGINSLALRQKLWLIQDDKLLVCGSTHPHEEEIIFNIYKQLLSAFPKLRLLVAPRHPARSKDIGKLATEKGFMPIFISGIPEACPTCINNPVFILDIIGELFNYYSIADVVFMGGSLVKTGGHNIIEPASLKKPVIFGPYMFNFRDVSEMFIKNNAAYQVQDSNELVAKIKEILRSDLLAKQISQRAYELIIKNQGATKNNIQIIRQYLRQE